MSRTSGTSERAPIDDFSHRQGVALVVGASGGLGRAIARMLLERGSDVALTCRGDTGSLAPLLDLAAASGRRAEIHRLDLAEPRQVGEVVARIAEGGLHTLVHAAGPHVPMVHLSRVGPAEMARQLEVDTTGFFAVVHAALPALRRGHGSIVAVTTAATARFPVRDGLSSVPKAAVEALIRGIAAEEGRFGVRANCVGPGMTTAGMSQRLTASGDLDDHALAVARRNIPLGRFGDAEDIAEAVCFLACDRAGFISGQKLDVDGGYGV